MCPLRLSPGEHAHWDRCLQQAHVSGRNLRQVQEAASRVSSASSHRSSPPCSRKTNAHIHTHAHDATQGDTQMHKCSQKKLPPLAYSSIHSILGGRKKATESILLRAAKLSPPSGTNSRRQHDSLRSPIRPLRHLRFLCKHHPKKDYLSPEIKKKTYMHFVLFHVPAWINP